MAEITSPNNTSITGLVDPSATGIPSGVSAAMMQPTMTMYTIIFDVYCSYKEAKQIWESIIAKYTAEDIGKRKFIIGKFYKWEMVNDKDIKAQINEYHKLIEDLKSENIPLQEELVAGLLIEKLPTSWSDYRQQLKHKHKQLSLSELITHIIIEDTNKKEIKKTKGKKIAANANLIQDKPHYRNKSAAYRFLVLKSDILDCNTIIETKNVEFFENIFLLRNKVVSNASVSENINESEVDFLTFSDAVSSSNALFWKEAIKVEIDSILQNNTWNLLIYHMEQN
ncbi:uncharacterized protein LOC110629217 [Manihot esculenta]|uniref:uncharacterized protein LOC110629217 n=1 Tax=Manihot esculenta TaxID=3983 RepID=UPI000B5D2B50|nr:uncharacterized protein LOC110629217 [Manihot esculenta]